jgi:predicted nucleotidyltransferase
MVTPVLQKHEIFDRLSAESKQIRACGVARLGLFGSFKRGDQHETSDIDLLVEFQPGRKTFDEFMHLSTILEELLQRKVELLTPEGLSPYLGPRILSEVEYVPLGN